MRFYQPLILSFIICSSLLGNPSSIRDQMKNSLDQIAFSMEVYYAPAAWKQKWCGWDLYFELTKAKDLIDQNPNITLKDYQKIVKNFLGSTRDYHVTVRFYATEQAALPLKIKGAEGRFFISWIDRARLPESSYPIRVGDEVVSFDGYPVDKAISITQLEAVENFSGTDRRLAEMRLTQRSAAAGYDVPTGKVKITVIPKTPIRTIGKSKDKKSKDNKKDQDKQLTVDIKWIHSPELITPPFISVARSQGPVEKKTKSSLAAQFPEFYNKKQFSSPVAEDFSSKEDMGARVSYVPDLGQKIWENDPESTFSSYIFLDAQGRKIGYVRIPHYSGSYMQTDEFEKLIHKLENSTSALVLDQVNNPGGSVFYLYALAALLTDKPLYVPPQRSAITQSEVLESFGIIDFLEAVKEQAIDINLVREMFDGYAINDAVLEKIKIGYKSIIEEWNEGRFFTNNLYLFGLDRIEPHPKVHYTKPILMLINELDFSGGDFLPAILRDNDRVTLMGTRTAGAGGYVLRYEFPNRLGIKGYQLTGSIAERLMKKPIENLGVDPDIIYELRADDLSGNYAAYKNAILTELTKITPNTNNSGKQK